MGKKAGLTRDEIARRARLANSGRLTQRLGELESRGFIRSFRPFGKKGRGTVYQLIDNFTLFYYKFMADGPTDEHFWANLEGTPAGNSWAGLAFERVCLGHVPQMKRALGISGVSTSVNSWSCAADPERGVAGSQIDLLIARRDQVIDLCEMKCGAKPYVVTKAAAEAMWRKVEDFRSVTGTRCALHPVLVTPFGVAEGSYSGMFQAVITANDLFEMA